MTESTNNNRDDDWIDQIKERVKTKMEQDGQEWSAGSWTEFLKDVALWLRSEKSMDDDDTIDAAAGLIKYRIKKEEHLKDVAGTPPDKVYFREALLTTGVPPIVCDNMFNKYVPVAAQPTVPPQTRPKSEVKVFSLEHLKSIKLDTYWVDCGKNFEFMGRDAFSTQVEQCLTEKLRSPPGTPVKPSSSTALSNEPIRDVKVATALVYSSVSGTGKTVSMLQLKSKLKKVNEVPVIVAYLGFNTDLQLSDVESQYIQTHQQIGAKHVLARRLAAATIISSVNPDAVEKLPRYSTVYEGFEIPSVETSKGLIATHFGASEENPIYIVAGVDEIQLLNMAGQVGSIGLGRLFLRILRRWQHSWHANGIRLLPLGTGIAFDWTADPATGLNVPLHGDDTTLISKNNFHELVEKVVDGLGDVEFSRRFSCGTSKDTVVDLIAAGYWPRVRLLEWWRDNDTAALKQRPSDSNAVQWVNWLCHWLRNEDFSCVEDKAAIPGKDDKEGKIHCLFELSENAQNFSVIPDGYASQSLIRNLNDQLRVPHLYDGLDVMATLDPNDFIMRDAYDFENLGFHVVGAAIHVGLHALSNMGITSALASPTQKKRLGLALWFQDKGAETHDQKGELRVPIILGRVDSTGGYGDFFPFETNKTSFLPEVVSRLKESANDFRPVYIRCGRLTCCDYLYFYVRLSQTGNAEFICNIDDAKHTNNDESGGGESVTADDQAGLFDAVGKVCSAVNRAELFLGDVRLLFVSNRNSFADQMAGSAASRKLVTAKRAAQDLFSEVEVELLNKDTFEFGPFSDIIAARRRKKVGKRKLEEV